MQDSQELFVGDIRFLQFVFAACGVYIIYVFI